MKIWKIKLKIWILLIQIIIIIKIIIFLIPKEYKINIKKEINNENINSQEKISDTNFPEYYNDNCRLIQSFAYKENPIRVLNINGDRNSQLFCLFDGHGGANVSQFLQDNFYKYFKEMLPMNNPEENFKQLFSKIDNKIKDLNLLNMGTTACIIYITKEKKKEKK